MRMQKQEARIIPPHNLFGDHGPRCPDCSGLGSVLKLNPAMTVKAATRCRCGGTGLDNDLLMRRQISSMVNRIEQLESQQIKDAKKYRALWSKYQRSGGKMSRQTWEEMIAWATADGTAVANTTTEAIIFPNVTIPGNYMQDGRVLRMTVRGRIGATSTPTMVIALRWGGVAGTIIAQTAAVTLAATTAAIFDIDLEIQTRLNGTSGSVYAIGRVDWGAAIKTTNTPDMMGSAGAATPAAVTLDLTADAALSITADWSAASASNTLTGHNYFLESLN